MKWLLAVLLLAACSSISAGKVVERDFTPAYDSTWLMPVYTGNTCYGSGTSQVCTPHYIYIPTTTHHPDSWSLTIEGTDPNNGNLERRTVTVDEATYAATQPGEWFEVPK